ncbi:MAG: leucyl/phenylalanyl-tRNA--protein transferase [Bacteroidota bacterium]|nr:leucyl/phenylalanyl-tRNA--protein transferase [Bacteroidota bacterium]MDP4213903.1 leucyl/phenylalanyl-tRNA--protein transferase [Bacteroidota bacterium]MDP4249523.1 leucyl/phenylalanyl-tRNA--protein transferase [Bacteroidota bacterium]
MSLYILDRDLVFPPVNLADEDGLLAIGGDLSMERLLLAYRNGIFPWYENKYILWWCPDPRFVLFPQELKVSNSMKQILKKGDLEFSVNRNFRAVIGECKSISRHDQEGTWITEDMQNAYINLHRHGYAHSAEAWQNGELVGGLYGIRLGNMFFGESMFSKRSNASKFAFIKYVQQLQSEGVRIIDCQVYTAHLESLGARMIPRVEFLEYVDQLTMDN